MIIRRLLKWHNRLPNNPQFDSSIEVFQSHGGYGIRATRDLSKSQRIIRVPASGWREFSADQAVSEAKRSNPQFYENLTKLATLVLPNSADQAQTLVKSSCLATKLMIDKEESLRHPYIEFLHQATFPGNTSILPHPLLMSEKELGTNCFLTGSSAYRAIAVRRTMYDYIGSNLFGKDNPLKEEYKWTIGVVLSRALSSAPLGMPLTLVPILDLVNHSYSKQNADHQYDRITGEFSLVTTKEVLAGVEVYINYGEGRDTASFMSLYGFYDSDNKNDTLKFQLNTMVNTHRNNYVNGKENSKGDKENKENKKIEVNSVKNAIPFDLERHRESILKAAGGYKVTVNPVKLKEQMALRVGALSQLSLDVVLSLDKKEGAAILSKILEPSSDILNSDTITENEERRRLELCYEVDSAAIELLGGNLLAAAREIVAASDAITLTIYRIFDDKAEVGTSGSSEKNMKSEGAAVQSEIFAVQILLTAINSSIKAFIPNHNWNNSDETTEESTLISEETALLSDKTTLTSEESLIAAEKALAPFVRAAEDRFRLLVQESETAALLLSTIKIDTSTLPSPSTPPVDTSPIQNLSEDQSSPAQLQWRIITADVAARELDGLLRLRSFCVSFLLAVASSLPR